MKFMLKVILLCICVASVPLIHHLLGAVYNPYTYISGLGIGLLISFMNF